MALRPAARATPQFKTGLTKAPAQHDALEQDPQPVETPAAAADEPARRAAAEQVHRLAAQDGFYMSLGQFVAASAWRS